MDAQTFDSLIKRYGMQRPLSAKTKAALARRSGVVVVEKERREEMRNGEACADCARAFTRENPSILCRPRYDAETKTALPAEWVCARCTGQMGNRVREINYYRGKGWGHL